MCDIPKSVFLSRFSLQRNFSFHRLVSSLRLVSSRLSPRLKSIFFTLASMLGSITYLCSSSIAWSFPLPTHDAVIQKNRCAFTVTGRHLPLDPQKIHTLSVFHHYTQGENTTIGLASTGVVASSQLHVTQVGDAFSNKNGIRDCDGLGTAIAGIINASPRHTYPLSGWVPAAHILSYRITSQAYADDRDKKLTDKTQEEINTLYDALSTMIKQGATIIVIPQALCFDSHLPVHSWKLRQLFYHNPNVIFISSITNDARHSCDTTNHTMRIIPQDFLSPNLLNIVASDNHYYPLPSAPTLPAKLNKNTFFTPAVNLHSLSNDPSLTLPAVGWINPNTTITRFSGNSFATGIIAGVIAGLHALHPHWHSQYLIDQLRQSSFPPAIESQHILGQYGIDPLTSLTFAQSFTPLTPDTSLALSTPTYHSHRTLYICAIVAAITVSMIVVSRFFIQLYREEPSCP